MNANGENQRTNEKIERDRQNQMRESKLCNTFSVFLECKHGERCLYKHKRICKDIVKGYCKYGRDCRYYSHDTRNLCRRENTESGCIFGNFCRFSHTGHLVNNSNYNNYTYRKEPTMRWNEWDNERNSYSYRLQNNRERNGKEFDSQERQESKSVIEEMRTMMFRWITNYIF